MKKEIIDALGGDVIESMGRMNDEKYRRLLRIRSPKVVDYNSSKPMDLVPPGCITAVFAKKDSEILKRLQEDVADANTNELNQFAELMRNQFHSRGMVTLKEAVSVISREPVFADIRYAGKTIVSNIAVPADLQVGLVTFVYSGGKLNDADFSVVEYFSPDAKEQLAVLLIRRPPRLTQVEEAALAQVPASELEINLADAAFCFAATTVIVAQAVVAIVVVTAVGFCGRLYDELDAITIPDDRVKALGPSGTARELLRLRRELLEEGMQ